MEILLQDVRFGLRMLAGRPLFTMVAVATLALGIGASSAMFSIVNGVLLHPLPYHDPDRLVKVWKETQQGRGRGGLVTSLEFESWREQNRSFADMGAYSQRTIELIGEDGASETLPGAGMTANLFAVLGVQPVLGRTFREEETDPGAPPVIILGHRLWQGRYGGRQDILGSTIVAVGPLGDPVSYTIVGVMPPGFQFPPPGELWVPLTSGVLRSGGVQMHIALANVVARLRPGVSVEQAQEEMEILEKRFQEERSARIMSLLGDTQIRVLPVLDEMVGKVRPTLLLFFAAVGLVLLIACANVANLLLVRAAGREREVAVRSALGANRWRLIRQLLTESLLLAALGGAGGLLLGYGGVRLFLASNPGNVPRVEEIGLDATVFGFTLLLAALTGLLFGLAPALQATQPDLTRALKQGSEGPGGLGRLRRGSVGGALVAAEVALSLVLLVAAGLRLHSFLRMAFINPGFNPKNLLTARLRPGAGTRGTFVFAGQAAPPPGASGVEEYRQMLSQIERLEGVQAAALASVLPPRGTGPMLPFVIEGQAVSALEGETRVGMISVTPGYFRTMGIPVVRGRGFTERDIRAGTGAVMVNERFTRQHLPRENPVGKQMLLSGQLVEIVGVVGDTLQAGPESEPEPVVYQPTLGGSISFGQIRVVGATNLVVRTVSDPLSLVGAVRSQVESAGIGMQVMNATPMEQILWESIAQPRFYSIVFGVFGTVALLLAAVGIYGVLSYSVSQRTREIGVRRALGAQTGDIVRLVVGQGLAMTMLGVAVGLVGSFAATRFLSSFLFGVSATDPLTFVSVSAVFLAVALVACYVPARRATRVDPMDALRYE